MSNGKNENDAPKRRLSTNSEEYDPVSSDEFKKRRYLCPGVRRYKTNRAVTPSFRRVRNRVNLCNRNWARISVYPFINFLRKYRRRVHHNMAPGEMARRGRCMWDRMTCKSKKQYYEQAARARARGFRT